MIIIVWFLAIVTTSTATPVESYLSFNNDYFKRQEHCKPQCPCVMNGILYDDGDTWHPKGNPCITYKCQNAFYTAIKQGCDYKGDCKARNSTWTEKCISYRCSFVNEETAEYSLIEGGCEDDHGNCWGVGQRTTKNCDLYECQIVDTCYKLVLVSKGCVFQDECKAVNSFWHSDCEIYQCVQEKDRTLYYQRHNEIMYWPKGDYALFETKMGCPVDVAEEWKKGTRIHWSNGESDISDSFHLAGQYIDKGFQHKFCVHIDVHDKTLIPRYQTYWDPGKYCIFRKNGKCPEGFKDGYIGMDDFDDFETGNRAIGELPDGEYDENTGFYFCCRDDGHLERAIVLPKERPFMLFMAEGANECQSVRGMEGRKEYFEFDDDNKDLHRFTNGSIPMMKECDNNTLIYFCYYTPINCGCKDEDGTLIEVGLKVTKGCVTYKCIEKMGTKYLEVVKGGCLVDKKCKEESSTWIVSSGDVCSHKLCKRAMDKNGKIIFKDVTVRKGCKDGDFCRDIGYVKKRGCYESQCRVHPTMKEPFFFMAKAGCDNGKGGCFPLGMKFTRNCITYQCLKGSSSCGPKFVKGECKYGNECKAVGSTWTSSSCTIYRCDMNRNGTSLTFKVSVSKPRCKIDGKCYDVGQTAPYGCFRKKCVADTRSCHPELIIDACPWKGKCMKINTTWTENCVTYKCTTNSTSYAVSVDDIRCPYQGKCIKQGSTIKQKCSEKVCNIKQISKNRYTANFDDFLTACVDSKGNCIALNETIYENCVAYRCVKKPGYYPAMLPYKADCRYGGVCKENNTEWSIREKCLTMKCVTSIVDDRNVTMNVLPVAIGCKEGLVCRQENETWGVGCYTKTCRVKKVKNNYQVGISTRFNSCMGPLGKCIPVGKSYTKNCFTYKCYKDSRGKLRLTHFRSGCIDRSGICRQLGYEYDKNCVTYKCSNSSRGPQYLPVGAGCTCDGVCKPNGTEWFDTKTCLTNKCVAYITPTYGIHMRKLPIKGGKRNTRGSHHINGLGFEVVTRLTEEYFGKYHHVVVDNAFNRPTLCKYFMENNTYTTGTVRDNRKGMPRSFKTMKVGKGERMVRQSGDIMALKYGDRKNVSFLSTMTSPVLQQCTSSRGKEVEIPNTVSVYNRLMGGVDSADQQVQTYDPDIKSLKMWKKILMNILQRIVGCRIGTRCREPNESWIDGCYKKTCLVSLSSRGMSYKIGTKRNGCVDSQGTCRQIGYEYEKRCITYKCNYFSSGARFEPVAAGCTCTGTCQKNGAVWTEPDTCMTKRCVASISPDYKISSRLETISAGCRDGKVCRASNSSWIVGCNTKTCIVTRTKKGMTIRISSKRNGCINANGACMALGDTYVKNCITYKCTGSSGATPRIIADKADCRYEDRCLRPGRSTIKGCFKKTCVIRRYGRGFRQTITSSRIGCAMGTRCYDVGETWKHQTKNMCAILQCTRTFRPQIQQQLCLDADGICRNIGEKGFRVKHRMGIVYCDCISYGNRSRMKCKAKSFG